MGKNIYVYRNSFLYSADVKPTVNKNRFEFMYLHALENALSMCKLRSLCMGRPFSQNLSPAFELNLQRDGFLQSVCDQDSVRCHPLSMDWRGCGGAEWVQRGMGSV